MSIALPFEIEQYVEQELAAGSYASRYELIVAAVELLRQHQTNLARLKADIEKGMQGEGVPAEEVFAQLRSKFGAAHADEVR